MDSTGTILDGWIPCDTSFAAINTGTNPAYTLMEYSILAKNVTLGIKENYKENKNINLYPNPTESNQTLEIFSQKESNCTVELYDIMGRLIKTVYNGKINIGKNEILNEVGKLPNSLYIYYIKIDGNVTCKKFIKT